MAGNTLSVDSSKAYYDELGELQGGTKPIIGNNTPIEVLPAGGLELKEGLGKGKKTHWDEPPIPNGYTPLGTGSEVPTLTDVKTADEGSYGSAFVAGLAPTGRDWFNATEELLRFEPDTLYDPEEDYKNFESTHGIRGAQDMSFLLKSESPEAFQHRSEYLLGQRERDEDISHHPIVGAVGSVLDVDLPVAFVPVGGSGVKAARIGERVVAGAFAGAGANAINEGLGDRLQRSKFAQDLDIVTFGLSGAFAITAPATRNVQAGVSAVTHSADNAAGVVDAGSGATINISRPLDGNPFPKGSVEHLVQAQLQSTADELLHYTKGDFNNPLNRILSNPVYTQGDDAMSHAATVARDVEVRMADFENALERATREIHGTSPVMGRLFRNIHSKNQKQTALDVYAGMQKIDQQVLEAAEIGKHLSDDEIKALIDASANLEPIKTAMKAYVDSGFATTVYDHIKRVGMLDDDALELILRRPTYMPIQHSYDRIYKLAKGDKTDLDNIASFIGKQIARVHPELLTGSFKLNHKMIGQHFLQTQRTFDRAASSVQTIGMGKDEIISMLTKQGMPAQDAEKYAEGMFKKSSQATGVVGNLKQRITWDWNATGKLDDGTEFTMKDLVDDNAFSNLTSYSRRMSHRIGLAQYGFKKVNDLDNAIEKMLDDLPEGVDTAKAQQFAKNVRAASLGQAVGEDVPTALRNLSTMSGMFLLANSGLYNLVDALTQIQKTGFIKSLPHMLSGLRPAFKGMGSFTAKEAKTLEDVLTGKLMSLDRWRNFQTHFADDFAIGSGFSEGVQYFGQSTRFLNGSEFVKRWQIGVFANMYVSAFKGAAEGSIKEIKFLKEKLRMHDDLVDAITKEYKAHGTNINAWDGDVRIAMEQKVFHESDNLAHTVQTGEIPSVLEFSQVGKVVFPFMRYLFAMQNKVLRRTYVRDGAAGVASVLAMQFPLAYMIAGAKEAMKGRDPSETLDIENAGDAAEVAKKVITSMSALGSVAYPMDLILSGGDNVGGGTVLAPVTQSLSLGKDIVTGEADLKDVKQKTPLNTILGLSLLMPLFNEDDNDE